MTIPEISLGGLLRQHRMTIGVTQEELAERAGISSRAVSDIERGLRRSVYSDTARRLANALGLDGEERAVFLAAVRGRTAQQRSGGSQAEASSRDAAIPPRLDRLIGRGRELDAILDSLRGRNVRLLTLTGTGGVGKTRLALEAAAQLASDFADGVRVVPLAALREPRLVASTLVDAVGVRRQRGTALEALQHHLRERRMLLVLDNFEHLLGAAPLIVDVLDTCPGIQGLVTSRAPLGVRGERLLRVAPLELPTSAPAGPAVARLDNPSVELLVERLRQVDPAFRLDADSVPMVEEVARRLDGLPLAIELAARRARHMGLATLLDQLGHRLDLLADGARDLPRRQQTMRATIAWSHDLLAEDARRLFRSLAVFAGGATLDAAATVAAEPRGRTGAAMGTLVDLDLVRLLPGRPKSGPPGEDRYEMLDVIREYAAELAMTEGALETAEAAHATFFASLADRAEPHLRAASQDEWYTRLDHEQANLRVALRWLLDHGRVADAQRLAGALWMFWRQHGDFAEGRAWLREVLARDRGGSVPARLQALWGAVWLAYHQADYVEMDALAREHRALAEQSGDLPALRNALTEEGMLLMVAGRHAESLAPFSTALDIARTLDDPWLEALSRFNLGHATAHAGDAAAGERLLNEALDAFVATGDARFMARARAQLAIAAIIRGDRRKARGLALESLAVFGSVGEQWGIAEGLEVLSAVEPDARTAARLAGAARALRDETATEPMAFDAAVIDPARERARSRIDARTWDTEWQEGLRLSPDGALELALSSTR